VNRRTSIALLAFVESLVLLAVLTPVAHMRSFLERVLLTSTDHLPEMAPDEFWFIFFRSLLILVVLQLCFALRDLYRWSVIVQPRLLVVRLVEAVLTALVVLPLLHYVLGILDRSLELDGYLWRLEVHPLLVVACSGAGFLVAYGLRMRFPRWIKGSGLAERVALVGRGPMIDLLEEEMLRQHDPSVDYLGVFDDPERVPSRRVALGPPERAAEVAEELKLQRIVIDGSAKMDNSVLLKLRLANVVIIDTSTFYERLTGRLSPESFRDADLFLATSAFHMVSRITCRVMDLIVATLGLILAAPLLLVTAILIKLESPGPVFYSQERMGFNGHLFPIYKFRSMRQDAETSSGPVWAQANDSRVTRVGKWLRKLRIDEIPQLWSVIRNDMALVGPRPEREFFVNELELAIPHYGQRHLVKPGVSGWAQINYSYGASVDDAFIKLQFDLYYIKHRSLAIDIAILLRTIKVVVLQKGAV
jgi:exopolysaccharide biosynthesis polyprenyl glycosylphosphotransferase